MPQDRRKARLNAAKQAVKQAFDERKGDVARRARDLSRAYGRGYGTLMTVGENLDVARKMENVPLIRRKALEYSNIGWQGQGEGIKTMAKAGRLSALGTMLGGAMTVAEKKQDRRRKRQ